MPSGDFGSQPHLGINAATFRRDNATLMLIPDVDEMMRRTKLTLVGKILTRKTVQAHVVRSTFGDAWNLKKNDSIAHSMNGQNIFCFYFEHEGEKKKVMDRRPWFINNTLMVLKEYDPEVLPLAMLRPWRPWSIASHSMKIHFSKTPNSLPLTPSRFRMSTWGFACCSSSS